MPARGKALCVPAVRERPDGALATRESRPSTSGGRASFRRTPGRGTQSALLRLSLSPPRPDRAAAVLRPVRPTGEAHFLSPRSERPASPLVALRIRSQGRAGGQLCRRAALGMAGAHRAASDRSPMGALRRGRAAGRRGASRGAYRARRFSLAAAGDLRGGVFSRFKSRRAPRPFRRGSRRHAEEDDGGMVAIRRPAHRRRAARLDYR